MPALTTFGRGLYAYVDKVTTRANVDDWAVVFSVDKEDEQNKAKLCIVSSEDKAKVISAYVSAPSYDASATRPDDVVAALDGCEWLAEVAKPSTHTLTSKWASLFKPAGTGTIVVTIGEDSGDAARTLVGKTFIAEGMPIVIGNVFMGMYSGEAKVTGASISGERVTIEFDRNGETFNIDVSTPIVRAAVDRGNVITIDVSGSIATSLAVQLVKALPKSGNVNGASKLAISDVAEVAAAAGIAHTLSESTQENLRDGMAMMLVQQLAALLEKDGMAARTWPNTSASRLGKTISEITGTGTFVTGSTGNKGTGTAAPQFPRLEALKGKLKTTSDFEDMVNKLIGVACKGPSAEVATSRRARTSRRSRRSTRCRTTSRSTSCCSSCANSTRCARPWRLPALAAWAQRAPTAPFGSTYTLRTCRARRRSGACVRRCGATLTSSRATRTRGSASPPTWASPTPPTALRCIRRSNRSRRWRSSV